jgi:hypothetical protein
MTRQTLDELLAENDEMGLLDVKPHTVNNSTDSNRIQQAFEEINVFIDLHRHAPGDGPKDRRISVTERTLQTRLRSYRENSVIAAQLENEDRHKLFNVVSMPSPPASLEELLDLDDDLLTEASEDIFTFRHARPPAARPEKISERTVCKDFEQFRPLFDHAVADLASGSRRSMKFAKEQEIEAGGFFILNGVMVYVAEVNDPHIRNGKRNARLRLIFENGTEGQNLLRSLATELYKDPAGRRLSDTNSGPLFNNAPTITTEPAQSERITGCIYIVRSLSPQLEIARLDGQLFKIGFTTGCLEDRIRNVRDDPTFLMAPVHPVRSYDAINMNANKFENLIHRFFSDARLDIEIKDRFGKPFRPREWFLLPLPVIEKAITMLLDGSIVRHRYDHQSCTIKPV